MNTIFPEEQGLSEALNPHEPRFCFYSPSARLIIDLAKNDGRRWVSAEEGRSAEDLQIEWPDAALSDFSDAWNAIQDSYKIGPKQISLERFMELLEMLPPVDHTVSGNAESFKMREQIAGRITSILVRVDDECWILQDDVATTHADAIQLARNERRIRSTTAADQTWTAAARD